MTVSTELQRIKTAIDNAYNAAEAKGETIPEVESSENLATTISSITLNLQTGENFVNLIKKIILCNNDLTNK